MMTTSLTIGQVVYRLVRGEGRLIPLLIVEEVVRKALGSDVMTTYVAQLPESTETIIIDLTNEDVFSSPQEAHRELMQRSEQAISKVVSSAQERARVCFPGAFEPAPVQSPLPPNVVDIDDERWMEMPDGTLARVRSVSGV
jgi:hypothetical protein